MKLKVTLHLPGAVRASRNIQITADATATAGDVAAALLSALQGSEAAPDSVTLRVLSGVGGRASTLPTEQLLVESDVRSGATVELARPEAVATKSSRTTPVALLRVVDGPLRGKEFPLPEGVSTIGRSPTCDVVLPDDLVSADHARVRVADRVELVDNRSSNGILVGGVRVGRVELRAGDVALLGDSLITVDLVRARGAASTTSTDILFNRSPRVLRRPTPHDVELPDVPREDDSARFPYLAMAAPLVMGAVMFAVTRNMLSLAFVGLSPVLMVGNWIDQRYRTARARAAALASFTADLGEADLDLGRMNVADLAALHALYPSVGECVTAAMTRNDILWSRRPEHPEFLQVRLGVGAIPSFAQLKDVKLGGRPELTARSRQVSSAHSLLEHAPVTADLRSVGGLGLSGERRVLDGLARAVVAQIATLHSPSEVVVTCLTSTAGHARWAWLEWLPHVASPHSPIPGHHLSCDAGSGQGLVANLEEVIEQRRSGNPGSSVRGPLEGTAERLGVPVVPSIVVIADDPAVDRARLTRVAERGPDVGVHVVWVADDRGNLPAACRAFVDVRGGGADTVGLVRQGVALEAVSSELLDPDTASALSRQLAPLVDAGAPVDDESDLPRGISVVSLFGAENCDDPRAVLARWQENRSLVARDGRPPQKLDKPSSLRAVVGHAGSEEFVLDLRTHGPHALVGGTTGAGKSEFLQAWVLGLAHAYSPDRVSFLFVDYKGGAAFKMFEGLPHYVGMVTDLDTYLVRRVLRSLRAELHRREKLLNDKGVSNLLELEKAGDPACPPSLIIVVDEFAALVSEVPEFVEGVVDVAQRGRSLGLHLILATQRPAGVIKENLRANTNLRVALRMADESDSQDVLGDKMSAHFDPMIPGRAAAKTGPGRITTFQAAFPGARTPAVPLAPPIDVTELDFGIGQKWTMPERAQVSDAIPKDIDRVVETVAQAARLGRVLNPRRPWLDPLAATYNLAALGQETDAELVLGFMDEPDRQEQVTEYYRPDDDGNIMYVGGGGSGKSTALRSLAAAASITPRGGPVHIYGLDYAGGGLSGLEVLPTVGSIVPGEDEERVGRLLRMIGKVVEERGPRIKAARADTLTDYRRSQNLPGEPRILLLLDGFANFRSELEGSSSTLPLYQLFQRILSEGRGAGVHVALTVDRPSGVPTSVSSAFSRKVVLRLPGDDGYTAMNVPKDVLKSTSPPGRAVQVDKPNELQLAVLGSDGNVSSQVREIEGLADILSNEQGTRRPARVQSLESMILPSTLPVSVAGRPTLGVADTSLEAIGFDASGVLLLAGTAGSGRTNAVRWLAETFRAQPTKTFVVHLSSRRSPLAALEFWDSTATGIDEVKGRIEQLMPYVELAADDAPERLGIFVEGYTEFVGTAVESVLLDLVKQCRRNGHFLVAEAETTSWGSPWPLAMEVRNARTGLLLTPDQVDGDNLLRTSLPRVRRADLPPGRGFYVKNGAATKLQLPLVE